jgi:GntR family transcriptional regulator
VAANVAGIAGDIDRTSGTPIYIQLREILRAFIATILPAWIRATVRA